jgi:predicted dienelactone hydrolase
MTDRRELQRFGSCRCGSWGRWKLRFLALLACSSPAFADRSEAQHALPTTGLRGDAPSLGKRGPHVAGTVAVRIPSAVRDIDAWVWYPAEGEATTPGSMTYTVKLRLPHPTLKEAPILGNARHDAIPARRGAPWPVIVFSHGFPLNAPWYADLTEHLATHGFVVIAPEHEDDLRDEQWSGLADAVIDRTQDVSAAIDWVEAQSAGPSARQGLWDPARIAVVGHSWGGYTALAMGGARLDFHDLRKRCEGTPPGSSKELVCRALLPRIVDLVTRAGLEAEPAGLWPAVHDRRVDASVSIAGDAYPFGPRGLAHVRVPVMLAGGTADSGTPFDWGTGMAIEHVTGVHKLAFVLREADHMFLTRWENLPWVRKTLFYEVMPFEPVWDKARAIDLVNHAMTVFLKAELESDGDARGMLSSMRGAFLGVDASWEDVDREKAAQ